MNQFPPPCDQDIFKNGLGICLLDARSNSAEKWVKKVAKLSGQKVDWHYSGGIANVLYIGDYDKVKSAIERLAPELDGEILRIYPPNSHGAYRAGDQVPDGTIAVDSLSGDYFVERKD